LETINNHIRSLNFGYRKSLNKEGVVYFNKLAKFLCARTVELTAADGSVEIVTADNIVIATGGRPTYPDIPGAK
jgi:pyruvate/2-oxoglutarate dehydrogenase complex dihydrolipoamide dehydrogenase (E3) component